MNIKKGCMVLSTIVIICPLISPMSVLAADTIGEVQPASVTQSVSEDGVDSNIASGTLGTSSWYIDSEGTLTIGEGTFSDNLLTASPWKPYIAQISKIVFSGKVKAASNSQYLFMNLKNLKEIDHLDYLNTSDVTSMNGMFSGCSSLESLDLSNFKTPNLTNMGGMFYYCKSLTR